MANHHGHDMLSRNWLPAEPLLRFKPIPSFAGSNVSTMGLKSYGANVAQAWHRLEKTGRVTIGMADELAVNVLRMHPAEVYGMSWFLRDDYPQMAASW